MILRARPNNSFAERILTEGRAHAARPFLLRSLHTYSASALPLELLRLCRRSCRGFAGELAAALPPDVRRGSASPVRLNVSFGAMPLVWPLAVSLGQSPNQGQSPET